MKKLSLVALFAALAFAGCQYTPVKTFTEAEDPTPLSEEAKAAWEKVEAGLNGAWGSPDFVYSRSEVPQNLTSEYAVAGWRGERVSAQVLLWTAEQVDGVECYFSDFVSEEATLPSAIAQARFVRYTLADAIDQSCLCGRPNGHPSILQADMLDSLTRFDIAAKTTRPVWITVEIPQDAVAGLYTATVTVSHNGLGLTRLPLQLEVLPQTLAAPSEWDYHLDFWQHPSAVARAEGVEMWSDAHFEAMRPTMQMLANAGQKVITATLNRDPWRYQCFDDYEAMIYWTKNEDGSWSYDYTIFDKWVEFMMELGIDRYINCYSMLPWGDCTLDYKDMTHRDKKLCQVNAKPRTPEFEAMWGPFLADFAKHLKEKGWFEKTNMAIDERAPEDMRAAADLIEKYAPGLGFAIADNHNSYKNFDNMRDVCVGQRHSLVSPEEIAARRQQGNVTTFYVCCSTLYPNAFTNSQPYESELLCIYGVARHYDGMLRWAYNSWPASPEYDSRFRRWASGDTFIVYPYARSSVRFERLIDGVEFSEKVRALRAKYTPEQLKALDEVLENFKGFEFRRGKDREIINNPAYNWAERAREANKVLNDLSRSLAE